MAVTPQLLLPEQIIKEREINLEFPVLKELRERSNEQAVLEEAARQKELQTLSSQRNNLQSNLRALETSIAREEGQAERLDIKIDQDILDAYAKAQNQADRDRVLNEFRARSQFRDAKLRADLANMTQEQLNARAEFQAKEAMRRLLVGEAGRDRRFGLSGRVPRGSAQDRYIQEGIATGNVRDGIELLFNRMAQDRTLSENRAEQERTAAEFAQRAATELARKKGIGIDEATQRVVGSIVNPAYRDLVIAGLAAPMEFAAGESVSTGGAPVGAPGELGFSGKSTYYVRPEEREATMGERAQGLDTGYLEELRARKDAIQARIDELAAREQQLSKPVQTLRRGQELFRESQGDLPRQTVREQIEVESTANSSRLASWWRDHYTGGNGLPTLRGIEREQYEALNNDYKKLRESKMYPVIKRLVDGIGPRTSKEALRQSLLDRYSKSKQQQVEALTIWKFLMFQREQAGLAD